VLILQLVRTYAPQKSVTLKHSLVLTGMFTFKPASRFVERYHIVVGCALNMEGLISNNLCKFGKQYKKFDRVLLYILLPS
jgi:hypothetical protein